MYRSKARPSRAVGAVPKNGAFTSSAASLSPYVIDLGSGQRGAAGPGAPMYDAGVRVTDVK